MIDKKERLLYFCIMALFLGALLYADTFPVKSARYPRLICSLGFGVTAFLIAMSTLKDGKIRKNAEALRARQEHIAANSLSLKEFKGLGVFLAMLVAYAALINVLGFYVSTTVFLVTLMSVLQKKFLARYAVVAVVFTVAVYLVFARFLHLVTPQGILF